MKMKLLRQLAWLLLAASSVFAQIPSLCSGKYSLACEVSKNDQKAAYKLFERGIKLLRDGREQEAYETFRGAAELVPRNLDYATAREIARQTLVSRQLSRGNDLLSASHPIEAMAAFREAVALDPQNSFAAERLRDAVGFADDAAQPQAPARPPDPPQGTYVELQPQPGTRTFHFRSTDTRTLLTQVAAQFGLQAKFTPQFGARPVRFDLENVDFATAIDVAATMAHAFWTPLSERQILIAPDDSSSRQEYEGFALQTFYVPGAASAQDLTEIVNVLRGVFETRFVTINSTQNAITVRAPRPVLADIARLINDLNGSRPEVMIDLKVYQVSQSTIRQLGLSLPLQLTMFNLTSAALALTGTNIQQLINQLISSGQINQANVQGIQALIAQLQNQQLSDIFKNPFASFGGGISRFGVGIPPGVLRAAFSKSNVQSLEHLTMRARQGDPATFRLGSRFPILNASFAPIFNSAAISKVLGNNSFIAPFPSFSYEDIGLTVKATPQVHSDRDVTLKLDTTVRALGAQAFNGVPVISNREYSGVITVKNGETAVVIGSVTQSEARTLSGPAGLAEIPVLGAVFRYPSTDKEESEIIITITPHIIRAPEERSTLQVLAR
jgi:general secretion pathway protein D